MTSIKADQLPYECETAVILKHIEKNLNQIDQDYFEGIHGILSVTNNGNYVTVKSQEVFVGDYDTQKLFDALENFSEEDREFLFPYDLWDYLDHCKHTPENQKSDNKLKPDDELSLSEKRQVVLVDMLLSESVPELITESSSLDDETISLIPQSPSFRLNTEASTLNELIEELGQENKQLKESVKSLAFAKENDYQKCMDYLTSEKTRLNNWIKQLQAEYQELENINEILREKNRELEQNQEYSQKWIDNLNQRVHDLECAVYLLQQENKRLTSNQLDKSELKPIEIQKEDQSIIDFKNTVKEIKTGISPKPVIGQVSKPEPNPTAKKKMNQFTEILPNQVALEMITVPTGNFLMGTLSLDNNYPKDEKPLQKVYLLSFAIGKYPITQAQYKAVMGKNPSRFKSNPQNPVENVSWNDAQAFCQKLSQITGKTYRLPTEAEWEYACRAGTTTRYYYGNDANELGDYAWYFRNSQGTTHPVGQKKPNNWGLYDTIGNVWEWCADNWDDSYNGAPTDGGDWIEISNHSQKDIVVGRGGSWVNDKLNCCRRYLGFIHHRISDFNYGFRVVCEM